MEWIDYLQWPAMLITISASWLVASQKQFKRLAGFGLFITGNILWIAWGIYDEAWALLVLQVFLVIMNIRGAKKNSSEESKRELADTVESLKS